MSTPLEYLETSELLEELKNRFPEMAFVGYVATNKKIDSDSYQICIKSSTHGSLGLAKILENACIEAGE